LGHAFVGAVNGFTAPAGRNNTRGALRRVRMRAPSIVFAGALALLASAFTASFLDARTMADTASRVDETHKTLAQLDDLSLCVERVVTMVRVFVLSGVEEFLAPIEATRRQIDDGLVALKRTFAGDTDRLAQLALLEGLIDRRIALSQEYVAIRRTKGLAQTTEEIPGGGERLAAEIRAAIARLERDEQLRLDERRTAAAASNVRTLTVVALTGSASFIVLLLAFAAVRKQLEKQLALERELLATTEHERGRIGHDLHDGLGQELTAMSFGLEALARTLEREQSAHVQTVRSLGALAQSAILETSRIARSLAPVSWTKQGLCEALRSLASEVRQHSGVNCVARCSPVDDAHDPDVSAQLFRIAQEAVTNALKHGRPRNIELCYQREGSDAYLAVRDDGIGIGAERGRSEGLGLKSMRYRARMINGTLDVSAKGRGTEVRCSFRFPTLAFDRGDHR
jgi:signal transduction histidine kinase